MPTITAELHRLIDEEKKRLGACERRTEERQRKEREALTRKKGAEHAERQEEEARRGRTRRADKVFRGCKEDEATEDLKKIFQEEKAERHVHTLPDGRGMVVIKKIVIVEGDTVRIEKGELSETGTVKCLEKSALVLESKEREKKYSFSKLLSSRYVVMHSAL